MDALLASANIHVPKIKSDALKPYWSDALSDLKLALLMHIIYGLTAVGLAPVLLISYG